MSAARDHIFDDLRKSGWKTLEQPSSVRLYEEKHKVPDVKKIPFRRFESNGKVAVSNKPVVVKIFSEDNHYFAENDTLRIYTAGDSVLSVIDEFSQHIVYFIEFYKGKTPDEVIGRASILKSLYDDHFSFE